MKKISITIFCLIISGCCTREYIEVPVIIKPSFDSVPERTLLEGRTPEQTLSQFLLSRVNYYRSLVEEWESWGISVYESVDEPVPESLLSIKIPEESTE